MVTGNKEDVIFEVQSGKHSQRVLRSVWLSAGCCQFSPLDFHRKSKFSSRSSSHAKREQRITVDKQRRYRNSRQRDGSGTILAKKGAARLNATTDCVNTMFI